MEKDEVFESLEFIDNLEEEDEAERQRYLRRRQRIEEMKRKKRQAELRQRCVVAGAAVLLLTVGIGFGALIRSHFSVDSGSSEESGQLAEADEEAGRAAGQAGNGQIILQGGDFSELQNSERNGKGSSAAVIDDQPDQSKPAVFEAFFTAVTDRFWADIVSDYGVLIDVENQSILAAKGYKNRISPASMTKVLTVLTAAEILGIKDGTEPVLDDTFTMTVEITDYCYVNDCSIAGFSVGEEVSVRELFYGTILPSGADAAVGLAVYIAGSQESFMELMNEKLKSLGLADSTHFTNCIGLYDEAHYSTVYDIAVILKEAADNPFLREVLSAHTYAPTLMEAPDDFVWSNWFLRRIEDRDTHGEVLCGKTGFVNQSGSCAASLAVDINGREYLCVTAGSTSSWQCIDDQHMLYEKYLPEGQEQ